MIQILLFLILFCLSLRNDKPDVCLTPQCKSVSEEISQLMDMESDPCSDFNKFACGGFENTSILKGSMDGKRTIDIPVKVLKDRIRKLLEDNTETNNGFETDAKVRNMYSACVNYQKHINATRMNKDWIRYYSREVIPKYIKSSMENIGLSGWPFSDNSELEQPFRWFYAVPKLIRQGLMYTDGVLELPIVNVEVGVDDFDRSIYTLKIDAPDFDIDHNKTGKKVCTKEKDGKKCEIDLEVIMEGLNPNEPNVNYEMLQRSLEIDRAIYHTTRLPKLANYGYHSKHLKDKIYRDYAFRSVAKGLKYKRTTMSDLEDLTCGTSDPNCPPISSIEYFQSLFDASGNSNIKINATQTVVIKDPMYFQNLSKTLETLKLEPYEIANYLGWKLVSDIFIFIKNIQHEFRGDCVNILMEARSTNHRAEHGVMNGAVGSMYIRKYFEPRWKLQVQKMVSYLKKAVKILFQESDMFSGVSTKRAIEKLDAMKDFVAYPEELLSKTAIDEYYQDLIISKDNHKANFQYIANFFIKKSFGRLGKIWNNNFWDLEVHQLVNTVNAYYEVLLNEFVITAGFLQDFNYSFDHPMYLNFAITGTTIGHEILHGFDTIGMMYGKNGELLNETGLWSTETHRKWNQYSNCISKLYGDLKVEQLSNRYRVNGERTLRENLADVGGIKLAYHAYKLWTRHFGEERVLPNLNFTSKQLFWIRSAQLHCSKIGNQRLKDMLMKDDHVPGGLRTDGMLMFSAEFAKDFKCPKNTPMNPIKNCSIENIWTENEVLNHRSFKEISPNTADRSKLSAGIFFFFVFIQVFI